VEGTVCICIENNRVL